MDTAIHKIRLWIKCEDNAASRIVSKLVKVARTAQIPVIRPLHKALYVLVSGMMSLGSACLRIVLWTPIFQTRLEAVAPNLYLYSGMPFVSGLLKISVGRDCRISGKTTFSGRTSSAAPQLIIGDNVDIGWQTTIAVGSKIVIGDNVRIAGQAFLAGYPGHPLNAKDRAAGLPDKDDQVGDIILHDDVWLATGVKIMAGVEIGKGTIVAAGSVVTHDLPANVLAAGVPATVIRELE